MPTYEWTATMNAGETWTWTIGDEGNHNGYFAHDDKVHIDAHQIREPFITGLGNEIEWNSQTSEFAGGNGKYIYRIRVRISRAGLTPVLYHLRVWW